MRKFLLAALLLGLAIPSMYASGVCNGNDLSTVSSSFWCTVGPYTFSNFNLSFFPASVTVGVGSATGWDGANADLVFQIPQWNRAGATRDLALSFEVTGPVTTLVGLSLGPSASGSNGANVAINERICAITGCSTSLATLGVDLGSFNDHAILMPGYTSFTVWKDISVDAGATISDFSQRYGTVPEPVSFLLVGSSLLALGLLRRRMKQ